MSETEETSYYEIALTSRQVLGGFIILLVCMGAAFFSGLWAGRGVGTPPPPPVEDEMAAQENPDAGLEEFRFFSDPQKEPELEEITLAPGQARQAGNEPPPETSEPVAPPPSRTQPAPSAQRPAAESPATDSPTPEGDGAEQEEPAPPPRRTPPPPPSPRVVQEDPEQRANPAIPRTTARRPDAAPGDLFVQVFSTRDESQARKILRRLLDGGFSAFLSPVEVDGSTMYRVRVGPFGDRPAAEAVGERIRQTYRLEIWITS